MKSDFHKHDSKSSELYEFLCFLFFSIPCAMSYVRSCSKMLIFLFFINWLNEEYFILNCMTSKLVFDMLIIEVDEQLKVLFLIITLYKYNYIKSNIMIHQSIT